ncbi:ABC-2 family transporter protein [Clostridium aceticum]|uniref:ABC-2 family transporter protein n=1 Tax=Clostridium aceticum TaxID=84022 RepID=A0A0G3WD73_9CLOT|nr:ABC transporter permease [Clostridium aceticum]AKL96586.1 ABC-2 family transporter protein [Clostridium aceticum]
MRILFNEIKKIFELKMIVIMMLMSFILYFLFAGFYIDHFPNGRPALDHYNVSLQMLEDYGRFMDEEEFLHFKDVYEKEIERADQYLETNELAIEAGISSYEEFLAMDMGSRLNSYVMFEEGLDVFWELQARANLIDFYEEKELFMGSIYGATNEQQRQRIDEVVDEGMITSIFPRLVFENYRDYMRYVSIIILLSVMFMLSPIYLRDKKNYMNHLQYTTKIGRDIFKKKVLAALIASFTIITLQLVVFFLLYATNNTGMFLNANIISIFNGYVFWYNFTFIQYIILTVLGIYALGFVIALMVSFVSSLAPNYITMIATQVPLVFFTFSVLIRHLIQGLGEISLPQYFGGMSYAGLISLALTLIIIRWKRVKIADIVN